MGQLGQRCLLRLPVDLAVQVLGKGKSKGWGKWLVQVEMEMV